ncbi:hypothetical protein Kpho01_55820 [Kitasatospora phosalacinea]|uniref:Uncharacterized protein n=1 Tax=Kitasatospora phosalacinea TaxID=2065 RepID=A0A9W6PMK5_9ACTN|nr:hypothetical protein Kpho01_55820 [Kitasatospora phosalacinea]
MLSSSSAVRRTSAATVHPQLGERPRPVGPCPRTGPFLNLTVNQFRRLLSPAGLSLNFTRPREYTQDHLTPTLDYRPNHPSAGRTVSKLTRPPRTSRTRAARTTCGSGIALAGL